MDSDDKIPNQSLVKIGIGVVKSSKFEDDEFIYEVEIEGTGLSFPFASNRLQKVKKPVALQTIPKSRFVSIEEDDIDGFINDQENRNTLKKTLCDMKLLKSFLETQNENRRLETIPPSELNDVLCKFFLSVRKPDGSNYEPNTLRSFMSSFDRHLRKMKYGFEIVSSIEFARVREVVRAKQRDLKSQGKGNLCQKADPITDVEIDKLWECKLLGTHNPESILNSLWLFNTIYFGLRGSDEHRSMSWGDISLQSDTVGLEYLTFNERQSKTRQGVNPRDVRTVKPKMWANSETPDRCPVAIYKLYKEKRPQDFSRPDDPFYLATHTQQHSMSISDQWFKRQPVGVNKLSSMMKRMANAAGIGVDKKLTNHSARKHLVQKLSENNIPPNQIMQITGHKNIQSINNYSSINENQHKSISCILSNSTHRMNPGHATFNLTQNNAIANTAVRNTSTSNAQSSTIVNVSGGIQNFLNGDVYGGKFTVNIHTCANQSKKRPRVIYDSDSDE